MPTAFDPIVLGGRELASRIVMAPMSRSRAYGPAATPGPSTARYYAQRASAGLIISEAIAPGPVGHGYPATPGLYTQAQVTAWRPVTEAVHAAGGVIFAQLMHGGRIGHPSLLPGGVIPVAPSPVRADAQVFTRTGPQPCVEPREMTAADITRHHRGIRCRGRATRSRPASTASRSMRATGSWCTSSWPATPTREPTSGAARSATGSGSRSRSQRRRPRPSGRTGSACRSRPATRTTTSTEQDARGGLSGAGRRARPARAGLPERGRDRRHRADPRAAGGAGPGCSSSTRTPTSGPPARPGCAWLRTAWRTWSRSACCSWPIPTCRPGSPRGGPFNQPDPATFYGGGDVGYVDYPPLNCRGSSSGRPVRWPDCLPGPAGGGPGVQGDVEQQVRASDHSADGGTGRKSSCSTAIRPRSCSGIEIVVSGGV